MPAFEVPLISPRVSPGLLHRRAERRLVGQTIGRIRERERRLLVPHYINALRIGIPRDEPMMKRVERQLFGDLSEYAIPPTRTQI